MGYFYIMLIALAVLSTLVLLFMSIKHRDPFYFLLIAISFVILGFLSVMIPGQICSYGNADLSYKESSSKINIVSVRDGNELKGSFYSGLFAFSGTINSEPVYFFYVEEEDGALVQKYYPSNKTKIYEDQEENKGYIEAVEVSKIYSYSKVKQDWFGPWATTYEEPYEVSYEFHIPEGTVRRVFELR